MSKLLNKVAELLKAPASLVQRSAEARAAVSGKSVDDVLNSWAGGESVSSNTPAKEATPVEEVVEVTPVEEVVEVTPVEEVVEVTPVEEVVEVTPVEEVVEEVVELKNESSLLFISGVILVGLFTFIFGFSTPKNQSIALVEASLDNSLDVSLEILKGAEVYDSLNCQSCHTQNVRTLISDTQNGKVLKNRFANEAIIRNAGNIRLGPDLSSNGLREPTNNTQWLERYLANPESVNRSIPHPNYNFLSSQDLDYLITYLVSLGEPNE